MHWLDVLIIIILALFLLSGIKRGFFCEVAGLVGIVVGALLALNFSDSLTRLFQNYLNIPSGLLFAASFCLILVLSLVGFKFLAWGLTKIVKSTPLSSLNRLAGGIVSVLKGVILISLVLLLVLILKPFVDLDAYVRDSVLGPPLRSVVPALFALTSFLHPGNEDLFEEVSSAVKMREMTRSAGELAQKARRIQVPEFPQDGELLEGLKELFSRKDRK